MKLINTWNQNDDEPRKRLNLIKNKERPNTTKTKTTAKPTITLTTNKQCHNQETNDQQNAPTRKKNHGNQRKLEQLNRRWTQTQSDNQTKKRKKLGGVKIKITITKRRSISTKRNAATPK